MSEWNAVHKHTAVHYGVLQISYHKMAKITGGLSPAVKSGEFKTMARAMALTEELLCDTIRRKNMDAEIKEVCERYAHAWYFDHPHRLDWQHRYFQKRHNLSDDEKAIMDSYYNECMKENRKLLPEYDYIGFVQIETIKREG